MPKIVLTTANARYSHTSLALRYLHANINAQNADISIEEFTLDERAVDMAERILSLKPEIVCMSIYIWNVLLLEETACLLKTLSKETTLVLGGPEVSFETETQKITEYADYIIVGEGEILLNELIGKLCGNRPPPQKILKAPLLDLRKVSLPYHLYTDTDIAHRVIYVEASRGCPFGCEFCLSSTDTKVRHFSKTHVLEELETLFERGARKFKFIDRSLNLAIGKPILDFFLSHSKDDMFVHFEMVPDRLSQKLLEILVRFPEGSLQLEVGVQTLNEEVAKRIGRKQSSRGALKSIERLKTQTNAHLHTDLVVGLPGETVQSFARGFDSLVRLRPEEIQIGILKRLRGAPIHRHTEAWGMAYNPRPPYDILKNKLINFDEMQRLKRFSRYFDIIYNSGNFSKTWNLICADSSPFENFMELSDWIFFKTARTNAIALNRLIELLFTHLTSVRGLPEDRVANSLFLDNSRVGRKSFPQTVRNLVTAQGKQHKRNERSSPTEAVPKRQRRHLETK